MAILDTALDPRAPSYLENRSTAQAALSRLEAAHAQARDGGGEREVTRHHARGKLLPRERIELLVDRDTALLELAAADGHLSGEPTGAGLVTAIGVIDRAECMIIANDPTVRGKGLSERAVRKAARAVELAHLNGLPLVLLWESSVEAREVVTVGKTPVLVAIFGACEEPLPLADHRIAVRGHVDLASVDALAEDERDALRLMRRAVRQLVARDNPPVPRPRAALPRHDIDDLLGVGRFDVREVLARVLDGSDFEELRPHRGLDVVAGFGAVHSRRVAVLANCATALESESVNKGLELIRLAGLARLPLLVLANTSASVALARALSVVPQVTVMLGSDPPDWALTGRGFRFGWPSTLDAVCDGLIDPRDTRTVVGICLSVMGGRR
jgi:acetyl-CoA carboxylase carboxyltransferase component